MPIEKNKSINFLNFWQVTIIWLGRMRRKPKRLSLLARDYHLAGKPKRLSLGKVKLKGIFIDVNHISMVKTYPKVYKVASTGKVYEWHIQIEVNVDGSVYIVATDGYKGGKLKTNKREVKEGKAGRSKLEQAVLQADRKFKDKTEKQGYSTDLKAVSANKIQVIRPMLAQKLTMAKLGKSVKLPALAQRKYDGIRTIAYKDKDGNIRMESRQGKEWPHMDLIEASLAKVYEDNRLPESFYFDGELFPREGSDMTFQELTGLVRRKTLKPGDLERLQDVDLYIFDFFDLENPGLTTEERLGFLERIFTKTYPNLYLVPTEIVETVQDVKDAFQKYISEGFEGLMLRSVFGPYEVGKRSKHLLKYKEFVEDEFEIVGFSEGSGSDRGTVIWELQTKDGKVFSARPKGSREQRREWFDNADDYIGKKVTVIYQELTDDGIPRFPVAKDVREGY